MSHGHGSAQSLRSLQAAPGQPQKHEVLRQLYSQVVDVATGAEVVSMLVTRLAESASASVEVEAGTTDADGKMEVVVGASCSDEAVKSAVVVEGWDGEMLVQRAVP